eukprot:COSAG01_NODE_54725_length_330_cov_0.670996_1_plen_105_part_10
MLAAPAPNTTVKSLLETLDAAAGEEVGLKPSDIEAAANGPKVQQPDLKTAHSAEPEAEKAEQLELKPAPPVQPKPAKVQPQLQTKMRVRTRVEVASLKPVPPPAG